MISDTMTPEELADYDEYILSMGPRFYGPDVDDEGANDCDGLFYWDKE
jgi:hypothetical protein